MGDSSGKIKTLCPVRDERGNSRGATLVRLSATIYFVGVTISLDLRVQKHYTLGPVNGGVSGAGYLPIGVCLCNSPAHSTSALVPLHSSLRLSETPLDVYSTGSTFLKCIFNWCATLLTLFHTKSSPMLCQVHFHIFIRRMPEYVRIRRYKSATGVI